MADLAGEAGRAHLHPPVEHDAAADAGAEGDHHHVVEAAGGAEAVLGQHGEVGVVLDEDGPPGQLAADELVPVDPVGLREVGGEAEPAGAVDHAGGADAHRSGDRRRRRGGSRRSRSATTWATAPATWLPTMSRVPRRGGDPRLGHDDVGAVQRDAEDLGPADVDAVGDAGGRRAAARVTRSTRPAPSALAWRWP